MPTFWTIIKHIKILMRSTRDGHFYFIPVKHNQILYVVNKYQTAKLLENSSQRLLFVINRLWSDTV